MSHGLCGLPFPSTQNLYDYTNSTPVYLSQFVGNASKP